MHLTASVSCVSHASLNRQLHQLFYPNPMPVVVLLIPLIHSSAMPAASSTHSTAQYRKDVISAPHPPETANSLSRQSWLPVCLLSAGLCGVVSIYLPTYLPSYLTPECRVGLAQRRANQRHAKAKSVSRSRPMSTTAPTTCRRDGKCTFHSP